MARPRDQVARGRALQIQRGYRRYANAVPVELTKSVSPTKTARIGVFAPDTYFAGTSSEATPLASVVEDQQANPHPIMQPMDAIG